jgi:hypothetical protein
MSETRFIMKQGESPIKNLLTKSILPIILFVLLGFLSYGLLNEKQTPEVVIWTWVIFGLPFGMILMRSMWFLKGGDLGATMAVFILNFILAGLVGGFIAAYKIIVAIFYLIKFPFDLKRNKNISQ